MSDAQQLLMHHRNSDLRSFEWHHLVRLCHDEQMILRGDDCYAVCGVAFSPDGKTIAASGTGGGVRLWNASTGQLQSTLSCPGTIFCVTFSPDGKLLVTGSTRTEPVTLWDPVTGQKLGSLPGHTVDARELAFSPDGSTLAVADVMSLELWDVDERQETATLHGHERAFQTIAFSPDGKTLASGGVGSNGHTVFLWNVETGQSTEVPGPFDRQVRDLAFSSNGKILATAMPSDTGPNMAQLWDLDRGGVRLSIIEPAGSIEVVVFSPRGTSVATASDRGMVRLWDPATGQLQRTLRGHEGQISAVAFSPDGKKLVAVGGDTAVRIWDTVEAVGSKTLQILGYGTLAFSPDFKELATGGPTVRLRNVRTGRLTMNLGAEAETMVRVVSWSPDGTVLASGRGRTIEIWNVSTGEKRATLEGHKQTVTDLSFSPNGKTLASGSAPMEDSDTPGGDVRLWDWATGEQECTICSIAEEHVGATSLDFSPDGRLLAVATGNSRYSGGLDGEVRLYNIVTEKLCGTMRGEGGGMYQVAFSPSGEKLATAGGDDTVRLWDVESCRESATLRGHRHGRISIAFSPDGRCLASAAISEETVRLWDVATGQKRATLKTHTAGGVFSVAFSPDGSILACENLTTVTLWLGQ